jgi:hypothetical protein
MKAAKVPMFLTALLATGTLHAQPAPADPLLEPVAAIAEPLQAIPQPEPVESVQPPAEGPGSPAPTNPNEIPPPPGSPALPVTPAPGAPFAPLEQQKMEMTKSEEGFIIKDAALNDIFQFLAKEAGRQYFHNSKIAGSDYLVTGHLNDGNPLQQMEELAFQYGLSLHMKGSTIYALRYGANQGLNQTDPQPRHRHRELRAENEHHRHHRLRQPH